MDSLFALQVLQAGVTAVLGYLVFDARKYAEAYASAKGTNVATREDIEEITRKIESVKADLTLNVEVRKAVAAEKVKRLLSLADAARVVGEDVYGLSEDDDAKRAVAMQAYWSAFRGALVLIDQETITEAEAFGREAGSARGALMTRKHLPANVPGPDVVTLHNRGEIARDRLLEAIRVELTVAQEGMPFGRSQRTGMADNATRGA